MSHEAKSLQKKIMQLKHSALFQGKENYKQSESIYGRLCESTVIKTILGDILQPLNSGFELNALLGEMPMK